MNDNPSRGTVTDKAWINHGRDDDTLDPITARVLEQLNSTGPALSPIYD